VSPDRREQLARMRAWAEARGLKEPPAAPRGCGGSSAAARPANGACRATGGRTARCSCWTARPPASWRTPTGSPTPTWQSCCTWSARTASWSSRTSTRSTCPAGRCRWRFGRPGRPGSGPPRRGSTSARRQGVGWPDVLATAGGAPEDSRSGAPPASLNGSGLHTPATSFKLETRLRPRYRSLLSCHGRGAPASTKRRRIGGGALPARRSAVPWCERARF